MMNHPEISRRALKLAGLDEKIKTTSDGIRTSLYRIFDENGVEFSGGEMQRVAIARAVYKNAPVLILDEPTSALDPKAEYLLYKQFRELALHRTAFFISHRLSSAQFCDKISDRTWSCCVFDSSKNVKNKQIKILMVRQFSFRKIQIL